MRHHSVWFRSRLGLGMLGLALLVGACRTSAGNSPSVATTIDGGAHREAVVVPATDGGSQREEVVPEAVRQDAAPVVTLREVFAGAVRFRWAGRGGGEEVTDPASVQASLEALGLDQTTYGGLPRCPSFRFQVYSDAAGTELGRVGRCDTGVWWVRSPRLSGAIRSGGGDGDESVR